MGFHVNLGECNNLRPSLPIIALDEDSERVRPFAIVGALGSLQNYRDYIGGYIGMMEK